MSDDSFFREVNEELRQDRVKAIWTRFGTYIVVAVVLVIVITAAVVGWDRYRQGRANASGDAYIAALRLAQDGKPSEAVAALKKVAQDGVASYPDLARMSLGSVHEQEGEAAKAVAAFDQVASDDDAPQPLRDMARIRAGYVLVDSGTLDDVRDRVDSLTDDSDPLRFPAREAVGLAAWKAGDIELARKNFQRLVDDSSTPQGIAGRARLMLDVIGSDAPAPQKATNPQPSGAAASSNAGSGDAAAAPNADADTPAATSSPDANGTAGDVPGVVTDTN